LYVCLFTLALFTQAQNNPVLNLSELLGYNARFNPQDTRQIELLQTINPQELSQYLNDDETKITFWINVYNSFMLTFLRDTTYEGVYTNFYKIKNVMIAGQLFSLFDIEHEFIRLGKKNKKLKFKKSMLPSHSIWIQLRPSVYDWRTILLLYRGLYGYPPFQIIEANHLSESLTRVEQTIPLYDWFIPYQIKTKGKERKDYLPTPFAVYIHHFYPKYEGPKFKEEEENPWVK
jgi:hypothetical protein